jgi:hypothetical protein
VDEEAAKVHEHAQSFDVSERNVLERKLGRLSMSVGVTLVSTPNPSDLSRRVAKDQGIANT